MKPSPSSRFVPFAAWLCLGGCLGVAEERADRDLAVGRLARGGAEVEVAGGLAAVRRLEPPALELWAQAPALEIALSPGPTGGEWSIRLENVLFGARLVVVGGEAAGAPLLEAQPFPTEQLWRVPLAPEQPVTLRLEPADRGRTEPWRFAVYADVQDRLPDVQDLYDRMNLDPAIRFALVSGDLTDRGRPGELEQFQRALKGLRVPAYATLGNHELGTRDDLFHDYFGRGSFSFDDRGVRFTLLDSASATLAPAVYQWLEGWLGADQPPLHVVVTHIPPIDPVGLRNGSFASRAEASRLVGRLGRGGVDLTVYGHVHSYYAFENAGIPAYITGGGGGIPERMDGIERHFLTVDVAPQLGTLQVALVRIE